MQVREPYPFGRDARSCRVFSSCANRKTTIRKHQNTQTKFRSQFFRTPSRLMESSLHQVWESAVGNPFVPNVGKGSQFFVGFTLLAIGLLLSGLFGLSKFPDLYVTEDILTAYIDRSLVNIPLIGIPASLAVAYVNIWNFVCREIAHIWQIRSSLHDLRGRCLCIEDTPQESIRDDFSYHRIKLYNSWNIQKQRRSDQAEWF